MTPKLPTSQAKASLSLVGPMLKLPPKLGLGTWLAKKGEVFEAVKTALALGYRAIDTASIYGNEEEVGAGVAAAIADNIVTRDEVYITTKLWCTSQEEEQVKPALQASLSRLGLDYVDLYLVHIPVPLLKPEKDAEKDAPLKLNPDVSLAATWRGMEGVASEGLTRAIGVSNTPAILLHNLMAQASIPPAVNQCERHPFLPNHALTSFCHSRGVAMTSYAPLGSGGTPRDDNTPPPPSLLDNPTVLAIASDLNTTPAAVLLAWNISLPGSVLAKSVSPLRLKENWEAQSLSLPPDALSALSALSTTSPFRYYDFPWLPLPLFTSS